MPIFSSTKKTSFQRRNALLSPAGVSLGAILLCVAVLIVIARLLFPSALISSTAPLLRLGSFFTSEVTTLRDGFNNAASVSLERDALKVQNDELSRENEVLSAKLSDIEKLVGKTPSGSGILAGVLARPPLAPYDTLVVKGGSDVGVAQGMSVYATSGIPLGVVDSVMTHSARIVLYSAPGQTLSAWVGNSRLPLTLSGAGGGAFAAEAAKGADIKVGDVVYGAGGGAIPIGTVARIDTDASSPAATLRITPDINPFTITWVKISP